MIIAAILVLRNMQLQEFFQKILFNDKWLRKISRLEKDGWVTKWEIRFFVKLHRQRIVKWLSLSILLQQPLSKMISSSLLRIKRVRHKVRKNRKNSDSSAIHLILVLPTRVSSVTTIVRTYLLQISKLPKRKGYLNKIIKTITLKY